MHRSRRGCQIHLKGCKKGGATTPRAPGPLPSPRPRGRRPRKTSKRIFNNSYVKCGYILTLRSLGSNPHQATALDPKREPRCATNNSTTNALHHDLRSCLVRHSGRREKIEKDFQQFIREMRILFHVRVCEIEPKAGHGTRPQRWLGYRTDTSTTEHASS